MLYVLQIFLAGIITTTNIGIVGVGVVLPLEVQRGIRGQRRTGSHVHQLVLDQDLDHVQDQGHSLETSEAKRHTGNQEEVVTQDLHLRHPGAKGILSTEPT